MMVLATTSVAMAKPSNPAFLGIGMHDEPDGCHVDNVTRGSGAKAAGLRASDIIVAIDKTPTASCNVILANVQGHAAGDRVALEIRRNGSPLLIYADLVSRDEIMRRRLVGQTMVATELMGVDDDRIVDLSSLRGKTAIVGLFDLGRCADCNSVFGKLATWTRAQAEKGGAVPLSFAVSVAPLNQMKVVKPIGLDVPLAIADRAMFEELTVPDSERISFMVIDCRGVVQYVAPIAPNGDDTDAVLDELFAAAEQASRRSMK
jgi:PDZ domain